MSEEKPTKVEQQEQVVNGPQTNIAGDVYAPVLSGEVNGPVTIINQPRERKDDIDRTARLDELDRESKARCVARWQAIGVSRSKALELSADFSVGVPNPLMVPSVEKPVVVLVGDFGAGKSLIAERLFQNAIHRLRDDDKAPIPVYLEAQSAVGQLREQVETVSGSMGNPHIQGATVIVDGADETGLGPATGLLTETRVLVGSWPQTTVVITSRPLPVFDGKEETVQVPSLSENEAYDLVSEFAERTITQGMIFYWPESVKNSICRPLFAILLGIYLCEQETNTPRSTVDLLTFLIGRALQESGTNSIHFEKLLQRLAVLSTDWGGAVPIAEVVLSQSEKQLILNSRLVVEQSGKLAFPLPILTQWFAAQSLAEGSPNPQELANDLQRLEHWRYSLIIFTGTYGHDKVSSVLDVLVKEHPAFIASIIKESISGRGLAQDATLPPLQECGNRIRHTMQIWIEGLGPLARLITPVREDGKLLPLGLRSDQKQLSSSWYCGKENLPEISELPHDVDILSESKAMVDWPLLRLNTPGHQPAWAWRWTFDELVHQLSRRLQKRNLPMIGDPFFSEAVWQAMLKVKGRGELHPAPIPLDEIVAYLSGFSKDVNFVTIDKWTFKLSELWAMIDRLRETGQVELKAPWPVQDISIREDHWIWEPYTPEQILARTKAVYTEALKGYQQVVEQWFPNLANRLRTAVKLPARFVGIIDTADEIQFLSAPWMEYYLECLPFGSHNEVDIQVGEFIYSDTQFDRLLRQTRILRPQSVEWVGAQITRQSLTRFVLTGMPITEVVYAWLWDDLQHINWVEGSL